MPPRFKYTKDEIILSATKLVQEKGISQLTARNLASRLNTSSKPIFVAFKNMEEVKRCVIDQAKLKYDEYAAKEIAKHPNVPYKGYGLGYIRFAKEDKELFKLLFMRDRTSEYDPVEAEKAVQPIIELISSKTGLSKEDAYLLHIEIWLFVHGIATTIVTSYVTWDWEFIDKMLSDQFLKLKDYFIRSKNEGDTN